MFPLSKGNALVCRDKLRTVLIERLYDLWHEQIATHDARQIFDQYCFCFSVFHGIRYFLQPQPVERKAVSVFGGDTRNSKPLLGGILRQVSHLGGHGEIVIGRLMGYPAIYPHSLLRHPVSLPQLASVLGT